MSCVLTVVSGAVFAQQDFDSVQVEIQQVAPGVYMLAGSGGNMGLSVGKDTAFLIDDQYAPLTEKIQKAIATVTDKPVEFVLNTHWHGDHTGGNENLGKAGALIVAHDNVRARMSVEQFMAAFNRSVPASPHAALPVVTFNDAVTFHLNDDVIHAFHVEPAHTDGDSVVYFMNSNVVHMGDLFFNGQYPFIDVGSGGSLTGMIRAANLVLELISEDTRIIPGHGSLGGVKELKAYRDVLEAVRARILPLVRAGKTEAEVLAARPTREFDESWGKGFMNPETFTKIAYASLKKELGD